MFTIYGEVEGSASQLSVCHRYTSVCVCVWCGVVCVYVVCGVCGVCVYVCV